MSTIRRHLQPQTGVHEHIYFVVWSVVFCRLILSFFCPIICPCHLFVIFCNCSLTSFTFWWFYILCFCYFSIVFRDFLQLSTGVLHFSFVFFDFLHFSLCFFCHFSLMSFMFWWFYNVFVMFQLFSVIFSNFPMVFFTFHWFSSFFNLRSLILFNFWFVVFLFSGILQCFNEFVDLMLEIWMAGRI